MYLVAQTVNRTGPIWGMNSAPHFLRQQPTVVAPHADSTATWQLQTTASHWRLHRLSEALLMIFFRLSPTLRPLLLFPPLPLPAHYHTPNFPPSPLIPSTYPTICPDLLSGVGVDSSVVIAAHYGLDGPGVETRCAARFSAPVQTGPGAHPASCTMGAGSFPGVKRPRRGVDRPPRLAPRLKKE